VRIKERFDDGGDTGPAVLHTQLFPAHAGQCLYFYVIKDGNGFHSSCRRLDRKGRASYEFHGGTSAQAQWRGDRRNSATTGPRLPRDLP
jgi:hypothetical protein